MKICWDSPLKIPVYSKNMCIYIYTKLWPVVRWGQWNFHQFLPLDPLRTAGDFPLTFCQDSVFEHYLDKICKGIPKESESSRHPSPWDGNNTYRQLGCLSKCEGQPKHIKEIQELMNATDSLRLSIKLPRSVNLPSRAPKIPKCSKFHFDRFFQSLAIKTCIPNDPTIIHSQRIVPDVGVSQSSSVQHVSKIYICANSNNS